MAVKQWDQLSSGVRRLVVGTAAVDLALRAAALADLARRPPVAVRGSKAQWGAALGLISSAGVLPLVYFRRGRRA